MKVNESIIDDLEVIDDLDVVSESEAVDSREYYAAKYDDDLDVWTDEDVAEALECGAISQEQADEIETFDEESWERENAETEARARVVVNEFMRAWIPAWIGACGKNAVGATTMAALVKSGAFTEEEALALID